MSSPRLGQYTCVLVSVLASPAFAVSLLQPTDRILAIDTDYSSTSSFPDGEPPFAAIDGNLDTKYLNFGKKGGGYILTLGTPQAFQGLWLSTANDSPERDPVRIAIYGTNNPILSQPNSAGIGERWTLLSRQSVALTDVRDVPDAAFMNWTNNTPYSSYRFVVETVKNQDTANSMQIDETRFTLDSIGANNGDVGGAGIFAIDYPESQSRYPDNEIPSLLLDGDVGTKYLNFGRENSGFIVTPNAGPTVATSMILTTANDAEGRDPASYTIWGTNEEIASGDDSAGIEEFWTQIASGLLPTTTERFSVLPEVFFANELPFTSYRIVFNSVVNPAENSMQLANFQLNGTVVPEPATLSLLAAGALLVLRRRRAS